jgi:hypothetical protein
MKNGYFALALIIWGCSSTPRLQPINRINEPLFSRANYASLGIRPGRSWVDLEGDGQSRQGIYLTPDFSLDYNVNEWASYLLLPTYWNFLMTGNQYADSLNLRRRKLHLTMHGGLNGVFYSARNGLGFPAEWGLAAKYLCNDWIYLASHIGLGIFDIKEASENHYDFGGELGWQMTKKSAFSLSYAFMHFHLSGYHNVNRFGLWHFDGDSNSELFLKHAYYIRGKHIIGPEIGYGYRNSGSDGRKYLLAGFTYRYVFD